MTYILLLRTKNGDGYVESLDISNVQNDKTLKINVTTDRNKALKFDNIGDIVNARALIIKLYNDNTTYGLIEEYQL